MSDYDSDITLNTGISVSDLEEALLDSTYEPSNAHSPEKAVKTQVSAVIREARLKMAYTVNNIKFDNPESEQAKRFDSIRYSLRSNRGYITRWIATLNHHLEAIAEGKGTQNDVNNANKLMERMLNKNEECYAQLDELCKISHHIRDDAESKKEQYYKEVDQWYRQLQSMTQVWTEQQNKIREEAQAKLRQAGATQNVQSRPKPGETLKPEKLSIINTPSEFRTWLRDFNTYYVSCCLDKASVDEQRGYLHKCLDDHFKRFLAKNTEPNTHVLVRYGCLEKWEQ